MLLGMFQKKLLSLARQINAAFIFLRSSHDAESGTLRRLLYCFNIATFVFLIGKMLLTSSVSLFRLILWCF